LEKYFPQTFEQLLLPTRIKTMLIELKKKTGYRLLLHSSPGTGKTTTSRLMSAGEDYSVMYLSGSNEFTVDVYRSKVKNFSAGNSVLSKQKIIIIDEAERIRSDIQDAFKILLDKCTNVNFIFITNEVEKMNEAIRSRCTNIDYDFVGEDIEQQRKNFVSFAVSVAKAENINFDKIGMTNLYKLNFPDFRHLLVNLQQIKDSGDSITEDSVKRFSESGKQLTELYDLIMNPAINGKELYLEVTKFKGKEKDCLIALGEPFFKYLNDQEKYDKTLQVAIIVSRYCDSFIDSINKFVTFLSCVVELKGYFK
jgi:replication factor C subunit 3/5